MHNQANVIYEMFHVFFFHTKSLKPIMASMLIAYFIQDQQEVAGGYSTAEIAFEAPSPQNSRAPYFLPVPISPPALFPAHTQTVLSQQGHPWPEFIILRYEHATQVDPQSWCRHVLSILSHKAFHTSGYRLPKAQRIMKTHTSVLHYSL